MMYGKKIDLSPFSVESEKKIPTGGGEGGRDKCHAETNVTREKCSHDVHGGVSYILT